MKKAVVIGGTGMVGNELIKQLVNNKNYSEVVSLVRRRSGFTHPKLNEQLIDFDKPEEYKLLIDGDVLFSALGTTRANAKTKDAQYRVDFEYQFQVAQIAAQQDHFAGTRGQLAAAPDDSEPLAWPGFLAPALQS